MEYKNKFSHLKVAVVHDWLVGLGGAERVVESILKLFPQADLYTSVYDESKLKIFKNRKIHTTFLQNWPLAKKKHQLFASLRPLAFEGLDFSGYDLVISSSSAEAKGIITSTETIHISYIHTPIRYYWSGYDEYLNNPGFGLLNPIIRAFMPYMVRKLRYWDFAAAQRPDYLLANSKEVQNRIKKFYKRDSIIINPPVDVERFSTIEKTSEDYYLVVSRFVPYKKIELAIQACNDLGRSLVVAGRGPEFSKLQKIAGDTVRFVVNPSDKKVDELYKKAKAFIFSAEEDFGITPIESMATGTPVICYGKAGASETVIDNKTGIYHAEQSVDSVKKAIITFEKTQLNLKDIKNRAMDFSEDIFLEKLKGFKNEKIDKK